ncbi:hypothetical protein BFP78_11450 [Gaetbulibacter sp. 5U11]|nr:hypothetical protein BFP78_11450 [Gaetbulibacter sp. 5U11]
MKKDIIKIFKETFNYKGKTQRKEYWTYFILIFVVFNIFILSIPFGLIEAWYLKANNLQPNGLNFTKQRSFVNLIFLVPLISATVRRLRDAGFSVWFTLVPLLNLILCTKKSKND